jgi:hypothetical protein
MAKESFNWKSLFVNDEAENTSKQETVNAPISEVHKFPESPTTFQPSESATNNPFLNEIFGVYEKGFESLNQTGFDFYEMYKSVISVGATNPQSYQMAFTMGKTINPQLSKSFLLEKSKYYTDEIEKVYGQYDASGTSKKRDLETTIAAEKSNLSKTINDIQAKIAQLQNDLLKAKADLEKVDFKNKEQFSEITLKIEANNIAKNKIIESINTVVSGINQYL